MLKSQKNIHVYISKKSIKQRGERAMGISNLQETLLMYTKYKAFINLDLSNIQMDLISATKQTTDEQSRYNLVRQDIYDQYEEGEIDYEVYQALSDEMENELEYTLKAISSWESHLMADKLDYEARLNEITTNETSVKTLLKQNLKSDFTYGGAGGQ